MTLREDIQNALKTVATAKAVQDAALAAASAQAHATYREATAGLPEFIQAAKEKYEEAALDLAVAARAAPCARHGGPLQPDDVELDEDGLLLRWYADKGPNDWYHASWEALSEATRHD